VTVGLFYSHDHQTPTRAIAASASDRKDAAFGNLAGRRGALLV